MFLLLIIKYDLIYIHDSTVHVLEQLFKTSFLLRALVFIVLVPSVSETTSANDVNLAGFVSLIVLQCGADLMLLLALDHEQRFRSSGISC